MAAFFSQRLWERAVGVLRGMQRPTEVTYAKAMSKIQDWRCACTVHSHRLTLRNLLGFGRTDVSRIFSFDPPDLCVQIAPLSLI